jgi:hypothetical protein
MRFNELSQNAEQDEYNQWDIDDTRRPRLTLKHLNKMRGMREIAKAEHIEQSKQWKVQYGASSGDSE